MPFLFGDVITKPLLGLVKFGTFATQYWQLRPLWPLWHLFRVMRWPDLSKKTFAMLWHLRHWLQYRQLRTWIHDNLCYLTINCDTGQHSQFLRCLTTAIKNTEFDYIKKHHCTSSRYFESDASTHPLNIIGLLTKTFVPSSAFVVFFVVFPSIWLVVRVHCVTVLPIVPTPGEEIQTTPKLSLKSDCT